MRVYGLIVGGSKERKDLSNPYSDCIRLMFHPKNYDPNVASFGIENIENQQFLYRYGRNAGNGYSSFDTPFTEGGQVYNFEYQDYITFLSKYIDAEYFEDEDLNKVNPDDFHQKYAGDYYNTEKYRYTFFECENFCFNAGSFQSFHQCISK